MKENIRAWTLTGEWICKECESDLVITNRSDKDYFTYCCNKECKNHKGESIYDSEEPTFILTIPLSVTPSYKSSEDELFFILDEWNSLQFLVDDEKLYYKRLELKERFSNVTKSLKKGTIIKKSSVYNSSFGCNSLY